MTDFVLVNAAEDRSAFQIAGAFEAQHHLGRHIEAAGFEYKRHNR